jgi:hypothetical protein
VGEHGTSGGFVARQDLFVPRPSSEGGPEVGQIGLSSLLRRAPSRESRGKVSFDQVHPE